jgi:hypothetical protein
MGGGRREIKWGARRTHVVRVEGLAERTYR